MILVGSFFKERFILALANRNGIISITNIWYKNKCNRKLFSLRMRDAIILSKIEPRRLKNSNFVKFKFFF